MSDARGFTPLLLAVAVVVSHAGCPTSDQAGGGGGATVAKTSGGLIMVLASATTSVSGSGGSCYPRVAGLPGVPEGWVGYEDWHCNNCQFYLPTSKKMMPPPIVWQQCPVSPGGIDCQSMVIDWTKDFGAINVHPLMAPTAGSPLLGFQRNATDSSNPHILHVIAEADGAAMAAVYASRWGQGSADGCFLILDALQDGKFVYDVVGHDATEKKGSNSHQGAFGGAIDELPPRVLVDYIATFNDGWACSASRVFRFSAQDYALYAYHWDMSNKQFISSPAKDPEKLKFGQPVASADSFFWTSSNSAITGINSWNPVDGARPFIRYIGDATRGAGNLGTDGENLVWTYGEGKAPNDETGKFPIRSIMTSPFTTDPAKLVPKRLASDPSVAIANEAFKLGCGRAAHGSTEPVIIVRLSDGVSWLLPAAQNKVFSPNTVLGLTCDHLYVSGQFGGRQNIARIRLDSLGPGIAPD